MSDIGQKVNRLADEWGYLEISVHPKYDENPIMVRNHTDEGLSADERVWAKGESLDEALDYAINGDTVSSYLEDAPWDSDADRPGGDEA